jgi:hypothetical protein
VRAWPPAPRRSGAAAVAPRAPASRPRIGTRGAVLVCVVAALLAACERKPEPAGKAPAAGAAAPAATPLPKPPPAKYQRDAYGKLEDCVADWGFAGKCTPVPANAPERARGALFYGPIYSDALRAEAQVAARREAVEQGYAPRLDDKPSDRSLAKAEVRP